MKSYTVFSFYFQERHVDPSMDSSELSNQPSSSTEEEQSDKGESSKEEQDK